MNIIFLILTSAGAGLLGAMGMGGGGILVIFLAVCTDLPQSTAQGINLLFFIPIGILSIIMYHREGLIKWRLVLPFAVFGICTSLLGAYISNSIEDIWLRRGFGIFLLIMAIKELFSKCEKDTDGG